MLPTSSPCWLDTTHWYIPLSAGVAEAMVSCVLVLEVLGPEGTRLPSLYHMAVASGMAAMLQVSVTRRPVRTRWESVTDVTRAGSEARAEITDTDRYCKQHGSTNYVYSS